ncbi:hypothetical protein Tco_0007085 [Tanacetum coccineum]
MLSQLSNSNSEEGRVCIWAMKMEHYLEYIDNEVWKVIQNGKLKEREFQLGKDGVVRSTFTVTAAGIKTFEKIFMEMDDAKGSGKKPLETRKGIDWFNVTFSLEAHGAEVSTEDANHKFLRSLPSAWSNLAMTMRTNPEIDNLSIDDLYNNLGVFEQEIQGAPKISSSAQNVAFVSQSKSSTNKVKSGFSGCYHGHALLLSSLNQCLKKKFLLVLLMKSSIPSLPNKQRIWTYFMNIRGYIWKDEESSLYQHQELGKQFEQESDGFTGQWMMGLSNWRTY